MFSLQNKKAVITGGGSGIGKAIAVLFAQQGAEVHIVELTDDSAQSHCGRNCCCRRQRVCRMPAMWPTNRMLLQYLKK